MDNLNSGIEEIIKTDNIPVMAPQTKTVYIVGPRCFQNELLSSVIQNKLGVQCVSFNSVKCGKDTDEIPAEKGILVLLDATGKDRETVASELENECKKLLSCYLVALINLTPGLEVEREAICGGVKGFFYVNDTIDLFIKGVQAIFRGELWVSREVLSRCILEDSVRYVPKKVPEAGSKYNLSKRELEILAMVTVGSKNDEIAYKLCISTHTVKTHLYNLFKKINVSDRLQAALWAAKNL